MQHCTDPKRTRQNGFFDSLSLGGGSPTSQTKLPSFTQTKIFFENAEIERALRESVCEQVMTTNNRR